MLICSFIHSYFHANDQGVHTPQASYINLIIHFSLHARLGMAWTTIPVNGRLVDTTPSYLLKNCQNI